MHVSKEYKTRSVTYYTETGFTLVEIVVVIAILSLIATIGFLGFKNLYYASTLKATSQEIFTSLINARAQTLASHNDTVYGVLLSSTTLVRFTGYTYSSSSPTNQIYTFEGGTRATSTIINSGNPIVFNRLTGMPSQHGILYIVDTFRSATTAIRINATGLIEYQ
jgi:prepilin-type N-terminal cleavage/methylation domain-containing protein